MRLLNLLELSSSKKFAPSFMCLFPPKQMKKLLSTPTSLKKYMWQQQRLQLTAFRKLTRVLIYFVLNPKKKWLSAVEQYYFVAFLTWIRCHLTMCFYPCIETRNSITECVKYIGCIIIFSILHGSCNAFHLLKEIQNK